MFLKLEKVVVSKGDVVPIDQNHLALALRLSRTSRGRILSGRTSYSSDNKQTTPTDNAPLFFPAVTFSRKSPTKNIVDPERRAIPGVIMGGLVPIPRTGRARRVRRTCVSWSPRGSAAASLAAQRGTARKSARARSQNRPARSDRFLTAAIIS